MKHTNMLMRDPIMYRILHAPHHRTGTTGVSIQCTIGRMAKAITSNKFRTLCSLEFKPHRELYNWFKDCVYIIAKKYPHFQNNESLHD